MYSAILFVLFLLCLHNTLRTKNFCFHTCTSDSRAVRYSTNCFCPLEILQIQNSSSSAETLPARVYTQDTALPLWCSNHIIPAIFFLSILSTCRRYSACEILKQIRFDICNSKLLPSFVTRMSSFGHFPCSCLTARLFYIIRSFLSCCRWSYDPRHIRGFRR